MSGKSTYTPAIGAAICKLLAEGKCVKHACGLVRQSYDTVKDWLERGKRSFTDNAQKYDEQFAAFYLDAEEAKASYWSKQFESIPGKSWKDAQSIAWALEKIDPRTFGNVTKHEISGPEGKPIESHVNVDPVALAARIEAYAAGRALSARSDAEAEGPALLEPGGPSED